MMPPPAPPTVAPPRGGHSKAYLLRHIVVSVALIFSLVLALGGVYAWDKKQIDQDLTPTPPVVPTPASITPTPGLAYPSEVVEIGYGADGRFGLRTTLGDPERRGDDDKLLTFDFQGETSNTRLYVDGETPIYGSREGRFVETPREQAGVVASTWKFRQVRVSQKIKIVAGSTTRRLDTLRIEYVLENKDSQAHEVGLRMMIDTLIGDNDGVPFVVPGRSGITDRAVGLTDSQVPDFIQALERADLVNPGVIVHLTLRGGEATPPDRVVISAWYDSDMPWEYLDLLGGEGHPLDRNGVEGMEPDSAIALYYNPETLSPGESRTIVAFYGLGGVSSTETRNPSLSLTFARRVNEGDSFWIVAMVVDPEEGQLLRLELPEGLVLTAGEIPEKTVSFAPGDAYTQVSWLVEAQRATGVGTVRVTLLPEGLTEEQDITVLGKGVTR